MLYTGLPSPLSAGDIGRPRADPARGVVKPFGTTRRAVAAVDPGIGLCRALKEDCVGVRIPAALCPRVKFDLTRRTVRGVAVSAIFTHPCPAQGSAELADD